MSGIGELARIVRFLAVGVLNTLVGLGVIYLCKWAVDMGDVSANVIGYAVGLANSFFWNRRWTFRDSGAVLPAVLRFIAVFVSAYLLNLGTVMTAIHYFGVNSYLAHAVGVVPYTVSFYLGSRWFVFRQTGG